jgi:hypothetical protein
VCLLWLCRLAESVSAAWVCYASTLSLRHPLLSLAAALPCDRDLLGGLGLSGICPRRNAPVFLDDDVSPPAPAPRGAIVTRNERLVSTAALR